eukprot:384881-Rhodomonas_salina.6
MMLDMTSDRLQKHPITWTAQDVEVWRQTKLLPETGACATSGLTGIQLWNMQRDSLDGSESVNDSEGETYVSDCEWTEIEILRHYYHSLEFINALCLQAEDSPSPAIALVLEEQALQMSNTLADHDITHQSHLVDVERLHVAEQDHEMALGLAEVTEERNCARGLRRHNVDSSSSSITALPSRTSAVVTSSKMRVESSVIAQTATSVFNILRFHKKGLHNPFQQQRHGWL